MHYGRAQRTILWSTVQSLKMTSNWTRGPGPRPLAYLGSKVPPQLVELCDTNGTEGGWDNHAKQRLPQDSGDTQ